MASTRSTIQRVQRPAAGRSSVMQNDTQVAATQVAAAQARIRQGQNAGAADPAATYERLRKSGAPRPRPVSPGEILNAKLDEILQRLGAVESNMAKLNHRFDAFRDELLGSEDEISQEASAEEDDASADEVAEAAAEPEPSEDAPAEAEAKPEGTSVSE